MAEKIKEFWKEIKRYEGLYHISDQGRVKSLSRVINHYCGGVRITRVKILKGAITVFGYRHVFLYKEGVKKHHMIHRLVADAFLPNEGNKPFVNHINGIKTYNCSDNLEWCTASENMQHAYRTGLIKPISGPNSPIYGRTGCDCANSKKVVDKTTGRVYESAKEAAEYNGYKYSTLRSILNGTNPNNTTLRYLNN